MIRLRRMVLDQFPQLLNPYLIQLQLLLFLFEDQQILFLLDPFLLQLSLDELDLLVPGFLCLFSLFLELGYLAVDFLDHLVCDGLIAVIGIVCSIGSILICCLFGLFFILLDLQLHLFYFGLLHDVTLMILPQNSLILN